MRYYFVAISKIRNFWNMTNRMIYYICHDYVNGKFGFSHLRKCDYCILQELPCIVPVSKGGRRVKSVPTSLREINMKFLVAGWVILKLVAKLSRAGHADWFFRSEENSAKIQGTVQISTVFGALKLLTALHSLSPSGPMNSGTRLLLLREIY